MVQSCSGYGIVLQPLKCSLAAVPVIADNQLSEKVVFYLLHLLPLFYLVDIQLIVGCCRWA
jgi:hypothetical protein